MTDLHAKPDAGGEISTVLRTGDIYMYLSYPLSDVCGKIAMDMQDRASFKYRAKSNTYKFSFVMLRHQLFKWWIFVIYNMWHHILTALFCISLDHWQSTGFLYYVFIHVHATNAAIPLSLSNLKVKNKYDIRINLG